MRTPLGWISLVMGCATATAVEPSPRKDAVSLSPEAWRKVLTPAEYEVLRDHGTERAFTGDLWDHHADGVYVCAACGLPLFDAATKFDSGTGWPSYFAPLAEDRLHLVTDRTYGMARTEVRCARCDGHLGHVFDDGPAPTGKRYCMNSVSLDFAARTEVPTLTEAVRLGGLDGPKETP